MNTGSVRITLSIQNGVTKVSVNLNESVMNANHAEIRAPITKDSAKDPKDSLKSSK